MPGTTPELNLPTPLDADDLEVYLTNLSTGLPYALMQIDALFNATTGHDHSGLHKGKPIASVAAGATITGATLTGATLTSPTITGVIGGGPTLTAPHMTSPVVDWGGLTVTAGNVGIGVAPQAYASLEINQNLSAVGGFAMGIQSQGALTATVNSDSLYGVLLQTTFNPNGKTGVNSYALNVTSPTGAGVNNYGIYVNAPSGGSGVNTGIFNGGTLVMGGAAAVAGAGGTFTFGATVIGTATAGGSQAVPATVLGYLICYQGGTQVKIPYFAA